MLDKLHRIVYNTIKSREVGSHQDYDSPSWAYKQADLNGYLRAYKEIMKIVNVSDSDT